MFTFLHGLSAYAGMKMNGWSDIYGLDAAAVVKAVKKVLARK